MEVVELVRWEVAAAPEIDQRSTYYISTNIQSDIDSLPIDGVSDITIIPQLNDVRYLNKFFRAVNSKLPQGGYFVGCVETSERVRERIYERFPRPLADVLHFLTFLVHRVIPKLAWTKRIYFAITRGRRRLLSEAEVLGRLVCCGFEIVEHRHIGEELYFVVQKARESQGDPDPSYGPLFTMKRVGKGGRPIYVHKMRTMHPYSEYLQAYVYSKNNLDSNGKLKNDFRITGWGRLMRKAWVDELPMLWNLLKGEMKLVGVRPISTHYLSLYPEDVVDMRQRTRPGLLPPFYADLPNGFDAIVESEKEYLTQYLANPMRTDLKYLGRIAMNIAKGARSQ